MEQHALLTLIAKRLQIFIAILRHHPVCVRVTQDLHGLAAQALVPVVHQKL